MAAQAGKGWKVTITFPLMFTLAQMLMQRLAKHFS